MFRRLLSLLLLLLRVWGFQNFCPSCHNFQFFLPLSVCLSVPLLPSSALPLRSSQTFLTTQHHWCVTASAAHVYDQLLLLRLGEAHSQTVAQGGRRGMTGIEVTPIADLLQGESVTCRSLNHGTHWGGGATD